jgi:hypothetical protein
MTHFIHVTERRGDQRIPVRLNVATINRYFRVGESTASVITLLCGTRLYVTEDPQRLDAIIRDTTRATGNTLVEHEHFAASTDGDTA